MYLLRLSPVVEQTVLKARFEATELKHEWCEPAHLQIGILVMPTILRHNPEVRNIPKIILQDNRITTEKLRTAVASKYPWNANQSPNLIDALSPDTLDVFEMTAQIASHDPDHIAMMRLDHLQIALIEKSKTVREIFKAMYVDTDDILRRLNHERVG